MTSPLWRRPLLRQSTLLFDWWHGDGSLLARTGQQGVFVRGSAGTVALPGGNFTYPSGVPRWTPTGLRVDPASSPRVAEVLSWTLDWVLPASFTVYARVAPTWAAETGGVAGAPHIWAVENGASTVRLNARRNSMSAGYTATIDTATTDGAATTTAPVTPQQEVVVHYHQLDAGGTTRIDTGAGLSDWSSAATALTLNTGWTLWAGCRASTGTELNGGLMALKIAAGLFTLAEMQERS